MSNQVEVKIPIMANVFAEGKKPEYLFWVGCAGAFDDRAKKVTVAIAKLLTHCGIDYAILGSEETCNGDPARRAGNEMLYLMQATQVIETFKAYEVKKIITACPHCFNIFKNEYPDLGGHYEVIHHTQFFKQLIDDGNLKLNGKVDLEKITYHDPCYLGRGNNEYKAPRDVLKASGMKIKEMPRNKSKALCCGAGGAQMFKEAESGDNEVYQERTDEALATGTKTIATSCPFCLTMVLDGTKIRNKEDEVRTLDIAEILLENLGI